MKDTSEEKQKILFAECPACKGKITDTHIKKSETKFKCPQCGVFVLNTFTNRCIVCKKLFDNASTLSDHMFFDHRRGETPG